jgi:small subunit ribosomal protein S20
VAHSLSAKKRIRQNETHRARNRWRKEKVKEAVKTFRSSLRSGDKEQMTESLRLCYKQLDKIAAAGTIHKNAASRSKARLAKAMNNALA